MTEDHSSAALASGVELMERAISYLLRSLLLVTPDNLARATPCSAWDVRALLGHLDDSVAALHEAVGVGHVGLRSAFIDGAAPVDPVVRLRTRVCIMLGAWSNAGDLAVVEIADSRLPSGIVTATGALEIAVHGWDIARSCGGSQQIPAPLADDLSGLAPFVVVEADRPDRFSPPIDQETTSPGSRLVAFLGRDPRWTRHPLDGLKNPT